jgi:amidase
MAEDHFLHLDAIEQAALVRRGEATPLDLVDAAITRVERLNPHVGAVIQPAYERARQRARELAASRGRVEGHVQPFFGVPFLMKDLGGHEAEQPFHLGTQVLKRAGWKEPTDSYIVERLRAAGCVILGRTNTPELGLLPTTEPAAYGPTRNPWDLTRSAGGSSGGSAAAVASGMVPAAHASDGGGSIRIPAAHCGLVGLKPTRGRSSFGPLAGERWAGFSCELVVSRTVRDTAALLDVIAGPAPGDPYFATPPDRPYAQVAQAPPRPLRIGLMLSSPSPDIALHPECASAARSTAQALQEIGHHVEESHPDALLDAERLRAFVTVVASSVARALDVIGDKIARPVTAQDVEPLTWILADMGRQCSAPQYLAAVDYVHAFGRRVAAWWADGFDLLLTPTTAEPPPLLGTFDAPEGAPLQGFVRAAPFGVFTSAFNMTGQPAISLPMHWTPAGLPVGAHLVAPYGREDLLLQVATQLEQARPWRGRQPAVFASAA